MFIQYLRIHYELSATYEYEEYVIHKNIRLENSSSYFWTIMQLSEKNRLRRLTFSYQVLFCFLPHGHVFIQIVVQLRLGRNRPLKLRSGTSERAASTVEFVAAAAFELELSAKTLVETRRGAEAGTVAARGRRWDWFDFKLTSRPLVREENCNYG